ncbi:hypothetical protein FNYG_08907 [Fusarium nygamai]|uniref:Uncharacterized protein n=1 Tax=Gibberella nygamai TaxID=42673 RepID=A0A2K0W6E9_GIBNY|nr:hypothetical protein FNYG_08907 [Fusarium nygamai]
MRRIGYDVHNQHIDAFKTAIDYDLGAIPLLYSDSYDPYLDSDSEGGAEVTGIFSQRLRDTIDQEIASTPIDESRDDLTALKDALEVMEATFRTSNKLTMLCLPCELSSGGAPNTVNEFPPVFPHTATSTFSLYSIDIMDSPTVQTELANTVDEPTTSVQTQDLESKIEKG